MTATIDLDQRVLRAIVAYFRAVGYSPSHHDIANALGGRVQPEHVGRHLKRLAARGVLSFTKGQPRSIVLSDRMDNLSDDEFERSAHRRGMTLIRSAVPSLALAFPGGEDRGIQRPDDIAHLLDKLA